MDRCKGCGKLKLFAKFEKGLCPTCTDKLFPSGDSVFGLTKDMFLHPEKHTIKEEPIRRENNMISEGYFTDTDGKKFPVDSIQIPFNPNGLGRIDHNFYEITSPDNIDIAKNFIMSLNSCLNDASAARGDLPEYRFVRNRLNFRFDPYAGTRNYCTVSFRHVSANNAPSHYKCRLGIHYSDDLFGEIVWEQDGSLDSASLTLWRRWQTVYSDRIECDGDCYIVKATPSSSGYLVFQSVQTTREIEKERIMKSNAWHSVRKKWQSVIDEHTRLVDQINAAYTIANKTNSPDSPEMQLVIDLCLKDIAISDKFAKSQIELQDIRIKNNWADSNAPSKGVKTYPSFKRLAIIYEKQGKYSDAISVCQKAIELGYANDGTAGQMPGRIAKLKQKALKLSTPAAE